MKSVNNKCLKVFFLLFCTFVSTSSVNAERPTNRLSEPAYLPVEGRAMPQVALSNTHQNAPEDPFFQAMLLLESPISPSHTLIREAIQPEYEQGIKHYLSLGVGYLVGSGAFLIDLDDYYGISAEGKESGGEWVTVYEIGGFDLHVSLLPLTVAYILREEVDLELSNPTAVNAADPYFDPEYFWGVRTLVPGWEVQSFNNVDHGGPNIEPTPEWALNIKVEIAKAWYILGPIEVKKQVIEACFKDALTSTRGPIPAQALAAVVGQNLISDILNFSPNQPLIRFPATADDGIPLFPPASPDFEPSGMFFDTAMPVLQGTTFNIELRVHNSGFAEGTGNVRVYRVDSNGTAVIMYDSQGVSPITLPGMSEASLSFPVDTSMLAPSMYWLKAKVYGVTPAEDSTDNNVLYWGFPICITAKPVASIASISPNPAQQGRDTVTFIASANDLDSLGPPPSIRTYLWLSDLGKTTGQLELYNGPEASFSLPASDLKAETHNIRLTVRDNDNGGDLSETVTDTLTIIQPAPAEGHDVAVELFVNQATVIHPPGSPFTGEVWVTNNGNYIESGDLEVRLENAAGEPLDYDSFSFSNLGIGESTPHQSFSLESNHEGEALIRATAVVTLDEDWSNNKKTIPVYYSSNLNPVDSFDGFEMILLANGETQIIRSHTFHYEDAVFYVDGESFGLSGEYVLLPFVVFQYSGIEAGKVRFWLWWPDNLYTLSGQYLTIPWGGTTTFEISRTSGSWPNVDDYDVEFISGLLPGSWSSSAAPQVSKLVVEVQAPHGSGTINFDGWAHLHKSNGAVGNYSDAFSWMRFQTVSSPPETAINSGPEGTISTRDVTFVWTGSDNTTATSQLQYAYRLDPCEPDFGPFLADTTKTYLGLEDGSYTFYVKARDLGGDEDPTPASRSFTVAANRMPDSPVNQYPIPGQQGISLTPTLVASPFSDPDGNDTLVRSTFQLRGDMGTYDGPVWDSGELVPGTTTAQITEKLALCSKYWWRCRYQDDKGGWSAWSNETSFTTKCSVNFNDFAIFANQWRNVCSEPNWCDGWDFDESGIVDFNDLAIFVRMWLGHRPCTYEVVKLTQLTNGPIQELGPTFNADGTKIVYRYLHEPYAWHNCDIWVMNVDDSEPNRITTDSRGEFDPSFVPDGRITYTKEFGSNQYDIWMVDGDGNNPHSFIGGSYRQSCSNWHPSGGKLAYNNEYQQDAAEIWSADVNGIPIIQLTDHTVDGYSQSHPVYSRSGTLIAYANTATNGAQPHVWVMNADGAGKQQITFGSAGQDPTFWWPDDSCTGYIQNGEIWLHNLATSMDALLLSVPGGSISSADLSPDGTKLVFALSDVSGTHIWIGNVVCNGQL